MKFTPDTRIVDVLWSLASGREILERHGLATEPEDSTLADACARAGADLDRLLDRLRSAYNLFHDHRSFPEEWVAATPVEIAAVINDVYHAQLRRLLPNMKRRLSFVILECGAECPELYDIGRLFERFDLELSLHCRAEGSDVAPLLSGRPVERTSLEAMVEKLEADHLRIARLIGQIRALTLDYPLRRYDCPTMNALYEEWREIEHLTLRAIFLEENKLVPLAREHY